MKTRRLIIASIALAVISTIHPQLSTAYAQGSLTPSSAPGPTMKSLDQIEARTPISAAPYIITTPGSYYLTTNLTVATGNIITIAANDVTLDLNGYTLSSTAPVATGSGVLINDALHNLHIQNGFIDSGVTNNGSGTYNGTGLVFGIWNLKVAPVNALVSHISVSGVLADGIYLNNGDTTVVEYCTVRTAGIFGINASVVRCCKVSDCGSDGISGLQVSDSQASVTGSGAGVSASTINNCYGVSETGIGVYASTANNCYGYSNDSQGIRADTANNCYGESAQNRGVFVNVAIGCSGKSDGSSLGVYATSIANTCYGQSSTGTGLSANIAVACVGVNNSGPSVIATSHYNMPP